MSLFDRLFGEFVDVIEWTDDSSDTLVYRFRRQGNAIKYGAKLTVREGQVAVFVNEGQVADVLGPGMYELETNNLPVLSSLQAWPHAFNSPFKAEVYFCSTRRFTDLKWGTRNPLMLRDPEFAVVRLRAFGSYVVRIADGERFLREIVGTDGLFSVDEISEQLRNLIASRFAAVLAGARIPVLDLAASYDKLGDFVTAQIAPEFAEYGLELTKLLVENISLPDEVEAALDKRTSMGVLGDLDRYLQLQSGAAMQAAAENPGGGAGDGMGMAMGMAAAAQMMGGARGNGFAGAPAGAPAGADVPPPLLPVTRVHVARDGRAAGPYTLAQINQQVEAGDIDAATLVWYKALGEWRRADQAPALDGLFADDTPPPLPPGA